MSEVNRRLNELVIEIGRSFLQYVGESWPWTLTRDADRQAKLRGLVAQQSQNVSRLVVFLDDSGHSVEFGTYPTEYTDKQFLSLEYLQQQLIENEKSIVNDIRTTRDCVSCEELTALLDSVLEVESEVLLSLEELAK